MKRKKKRQYKTFEWNLESEFEHACIDLAADILSETGIRFAFEQLRNTSERIES